MGGGTGGMEQVCEDNQLWRVVAPVLALCHQLQLFQHEAELAVIIGAVIEHVHDEPMSHFICKCYAKMQLPAAVTYFWG